MADENQSSTSNFEETQNLRDVVEKDSSRSNDQISNESKQDDLSTENPMVRRLMDTFWREVIG